MRDQGSSLAAVTDGHLWARLEDGDVSALEGLYDRYASYVYAIALRILADPPEAEEVTQDVFWRLWKGGAPYDPERGRFGTWLFAITRNRCLDRVRAKKPRSHDALLSAVADPPAPGNPETDAYLLERRRQVAAALNELPEPQRRALELCFFSGLSHREVADRLGEPLGTVKSRIRMGMNKLKLMLAGMESAP